MNGGGGSGGGGRVGGVVVFVHTRETAGKINLERGT